MYEYMFYGHMIHTYISTHMKPLTCLTYPANLLPPKLCLKERRKLWNSAKERGNLNAGKERGNLEFHSAKEEMYVCMYVCMYVSML